MKLFLARALAIASPSPRSWQLPSPGANSPDPIHPSPADQSGQHQSPPAQASRQSHLPALIDANGHDRQHHRSRRETAAADAVTASTVDDAERQAVTVTGLDLDVHLNTAAQQLAARALVTVRNDGTAPLSRIPLQISSSLNWERIRIAGRDASFPVATINSDSDHTGQLHEAVSPARRAPRPRRDRSARRHLLRHHRLTAQRLLSVGTPEDSRFSLRLGPDQPDFTGLRGFGNVVWYPVVSVPVLIGDGARLFDEIGRQKLGSVRTSIPPAPHRRVSPRTSAHRRRR